MYCDTGVLEMNIFILVSDFKACSCQKKMMEISQIYVTKKGLWQRANAWNISLEIVNGGLYVINSVCKTNFSCYTPTDVAQQFFSKLSPLSKKKKEKKTVEVWMKRTLGHWRRNLEENWGRYQMMTACP